CAQSDFRDNSKAAAASSFERPEQIGIGAGVGYANSAAGGNDFGFEESGGRGAEALRKRTEAAALNETGYANRGAAASLNVAPRFGGNRVIDVDPHRSGFDGDSGDR